jgi:hypothetical protein
VGAVKILIALAISLAAQATPVLFPLHGVTINPELKLEDENLQLRKDQGFVYTASNARYDVEVKGTPLKSEKAAKQLESVELNALKNLYSVRGSPYPGQISEIVQCEKAFLPKVGKITVDGMTTETLTAGATARKLFGACDHDQVHFWAEFFGFFDRDSSRSITVRVFYKNPDLKNLARSTHELNEMVNHLFVGS